MWAQRKGSYLTFSAAPFLSGLKSMAQYLLSCPCGCAVVLIDMDVQVPWGQSRLEGHGGGACLELPWNQDAFQNPQAMEHCRHGSVGQRQG